MDGLHSSLPPAERVLAQLCEWPALRAVPAPDGGAALAAGDRQILHLHSADEAELFLTWPVIQRLAAVLADSPQVRFEHGGDWLQVRLYSTSDVALLASLASVAIQAHTPAVREPGDRDSPCPQAVVADSMLALSPRT